MNRPWRRFLRRFMRDFSIPTLQQLFATVSNAELNEWYAFYQIEPGESWKQSAMITAAIYNCLTENKGEPFQIADFVPSVREHKEQSVEEAHAKFRMSIGGVIDADAEKESKPAT